MEQGIARLEVDVDKLRFQSRQKNIHEGILRKIFLAQKKEQKAVDENKILKLENELMKVKNAKAVGNEKIKLDNEKLKEKIKTNKTLHKDQIWMKDVRISELILTIKSMKTKLKGQDKSQDKFLSKFAVLQRQSAINIAKLDHKRDLMESEGEQKKDSMKKEEGKFS